MYNTMRNAPVVKRGKCMYADTTEYEVIIVRWHTLYGTGDYEDTVEIQGDQSVECYYVFYEDLIKKGDFSAGGGMFLSLEEAIMSVESGKFVGWI